MRLFQDKYNNIYVDYRVIKIDLLTLVMVQNKDYVRFQDGIDLSKIKTKTAFKKFMKDMLFDLTQIGANEAWQYEHDEEYNKKCVEDIKNLYIKLFIKVF